jgi:type IV secretion system protein VirB5
MEARWWRRAFFFSVPALALIAIVSVIGLGTISYHRDIRVFAVPVNDKGAQSGPIIAVNGLPKATDAEEREVVADWVINAFRVSPDAIAEKTFLDFVRTHSTAEAYRMINDYYRTPKGDGSLSPFVRSQKSTVEVRIVRIDSISPQTYQVTWTEIQRDFTGREMNRKSVVGTLSVAVVQNDPSFTDQNPFSVDVTRFSLSQNFGA